MSRGPRARVTPGETTWDRFHPVTRLVDLKEEMLALATTRAREAAVQFARASGSTVGPIKRAQQGVFQILPRDPVPGAAAEDQVAKTVRVVSTVDYVLLD